MWAPPVGQRIPALACSRTLLWTAPAGRLPNSCPSIACQPARRRSRSYNNRTAGFDQVYGAPLFDHLAADVTAGETFNEAMTSNSTREAEAVVAAYDFTGLQSIVDVARAWTPDR